MIPMSMPLNQLWNQLTKSSGKKLARFWWSSYCIHLRAQPNPISHHRHPRDPPSQDHLLASRPSMSSGILWLLSSWSEVVTVLMTTHSSAVQLTKHTYWRSTIRHVPPSVLMSHQLLSRLLTGGSSWWVSNTPPEADLSVLSEVSSEHSYYRGREKAIYVHVAVLTPLHTGEKKIKPVAVPVGFKVVNGYRRIGNRQCLDYNHP